jgi:hypothetical protein
MAQSGFTYDGTYLSLIGTQRIQSDINFNVSTTRPIYEIPFFDGCGAYFDYCVVNSLGYKRLGTVMAAWDDLGVVWTDTSTPDLNGSTSDLSFIVDINGTNVELTSVVTFVAGVSWTIRLSVRVIY